jgi:hypothetical protein
MLPPRLRLRRCAAPRGEQLAPWGGPAALVCKAVIDAAGKLGLLRLLEQAIRAKVDAPVVARPRLGDRARARRIERFSRRLANVGFRQPAGETGGRAVWRKPDDRFLDRTERKEPHFPPVRRVSVAARQIGERGLPASLELDVVLGRAVVRESCGDTCARRRDVQLRRKRARRRDGLGARHLDVEVHDRDRERKQARRDGECEQRRDRIGDPERRLAHDPAQGVVGPAGARSGGCAIAAPVPITPRAARSRSIASSSPRRSRRTFAVCSPRSGGASA